MATLQELVAQYGLAIVFVGTLLEGETIVVVAGFLAHQGLIDPVAVAASAFLGSFLGDQFWFYFGRRAASHPLVRRVTRRPVFEKVRSAIEDHPKKFILTFRFVYGIRTISPIAIGLSNVRARDFLILNAVAALIWAVAFTALGYASGQAVESVLGKLKAIEHKIFAAVAIGAFVYAAYHIGRWAWRRAGNRTSDSGKPEIRERHDDSAS